MAEAGGEGVVNEDISHATLTGAPITRAEGVGEEVEMCWKKELSINKMGHCLGVGWALVTRRKSKRLLIRLDSSPWTQQQEEVNRKIN